MFRSILCVLGAPPGETEDFYRDYGLTLLAIPTSIVALFLGLFGVFGAAFWVCTIIYATCVVLAKRRTILVGAPVAFLAVRFGIGFLLTGRLDALFIALGLLAAVLLIGRYDAKR